ncbi:MAG: hypothetical protein K6V36_07430 [Anaerolineae bacterium]|nr:hypothetical protein [Anaerolineae bacterium]
MLPDLNQLWQLLVALVLLLSGGQVQVPEWLPDDLSGLENLPWQELLPAEWPLMLNGVPSLQPATLPPMSEAAPTTRRVTAARPASQAVTQGLGEASPALAAPGAMSLPSLDGGVAAWAADPGQVGNRIARRSRVVRTSPDYTGEEQELPQTTSAAPTLAGVGLVGLGALGGLAMIATRRRR